MAEYSIVADGTDLCELTGAHIVGFSQEMPEPKVVKVDIPAGSDLDITEALGPVAYHNGRHTLELLVTGETEQERVTRCRELVARLHGKAMDYRLTWDVGYTYHGRFKVEQERRNHLASIMTLDIDRNPWKTSVARETHVVDCHPDGSYTLEGSMRYHTVRAKLLQSGGAELSVTEPTIYNDRDRGTYTLASDVFGSSTVWLMVGEWVLYEDGTEDLKVNPDRFSVSGGDATIDGTYSFDWETDFVGYVIVDGDMRFGLTDYQKATVDFYRWDV